MARHKPLWQTCFQTAKHNKNARNLTVKENKNILLFPFSEAAILCYLRLYCDPFWRADVVM